MNSTDVSTHDGELSEDDMIVRAWRMEQLRKLGLAPLVAQLFADLVDWHEIADLLRRGCPLDLALEIAR